ncbi:SDR family NAD(P)-dependent oxidoreductase [Candidatus Marimicrobium litorale]|uniref:SDR family oxidoreductase n=1 Tax=Candidatus Marimicrobium litorale TaxID=2518991 RepID=A0ABT3T1Q0_9GAMM|nr:SDR family NAD(P)-dependent oxidoreductase [Candidatus Marimicrobium litorale]MCX2976192.1 SDR family oxidoreductase [Candidatus Marimicrobium litorale]
MSNLKNKVAIVTGAASGIGLACAQRYAREGAVVIGLDRNRTDAWNSFEAAIDACRFHQVDVTDADVTNTAVARTVEEFGRIDILLTAAGIGEAGPVNMLDEDTWDRVINVNLKGTFLSIKAVLDTMMAQRSGSIVTVASVEGLNGTEGGSVYNASKGGVVMLTKNIAIDYGRLGIRCNTICPGFINTPLLHEVMDAMPDFKKDVERETKIGRFGKPEEIAGAAYFLASDDASFVTGHSLVVDGGYTAGHSHGIVELMGLV